MWKTLRYLPPGDRCRPFWYVSRMFDQIGMFGKFTYHFPVFQVLVFAAALLLVQAVFSVCAVRYTGRLSLVERIRAAD